jgi:apolipoprotein N-acyltransferase
MLHVALLRAEQGSCGLCFFVGLSPVYLQINRYASFRRLVGLMTEVPTQVTVASPPLLFGPIFFLTGLWWVSGPSVWYNPFPYLYPQKFQSGESQ